MYAFLYLLCSVFVGLLAIGQRGGFILFFILSLGLSPIVGLLILVVASPTVLRPVRGAYDNCACDEFRHHRK
jgi:hypothetical protein